ncbi:MAG: hypothetical protein AAGJ93_13765, partial [Bacteroidota bacterium]
MRIVIFVVAFFSALLFLKATTITSTLTGGNWGQPSSWIGGVVPVAGDDVIIQSQIVYTGGGELDLNTLQITTGGELSAWLLSSGFVLSPKLTIQNTLNLEAGTLLSSFVTLDVYGTTTNDGHLAPGARSSFNFHGDLLNNGLVTGASATQGANQYNSQIYIYGNLVNTGDWQSPRNWLEGAIEQEGNWTDDHNTYFIGSDIQMFCWQDTIQGGNFWVEDSSLVIEVECDLVIHNALVDLNQATLDMNNYSLTIINQRIDNGFISNAEQVYFYEPNASHINLITLTGNNLRLYGHLRTVGAITLAAADSLHIYGDITAYGNYSTLLNFNGTTTLYAGVTLDNAGASFAGKAYVYGKLTNNGTWYVSETRAFDDIINNGDFFSSLYLDGDDIQGLRGSFRYIQSNNSRNKISILPFNQEPGYLRCSDRLRLNSDTLDARYGDIFLEDFGNIELGGVLEQTDTIFISQNASPFFRDLFFQDSVVVTGNWASGNITAYDCFAVTDTASFDGDNFFRGVFINEGHIQKYNQSAASRLLLGADLYNTGTWRNDISGVLDGTDDQTVYLLNQSEINTSIAFESLLPIGPYQWKKNNSNLLYLNFSIPSFAVDNKLAPIHAG